MRFLALTPVLLSFSDEFSPIDIVWGEQLSMGMGDGVGGENFTPGWAGLIADLLLFTSREEITSWGTQP